MSKPKGKIFPLHIPAHGGDSLINRWIRETGQAERGEKPICDFNHIYKERKKPKKEKP